MSAGPSTVCYGHLNRARRDPAATAVSADLWAWRNWGLQRHATYFTTCIVVNHQRLCESLVSLGLSHDGAIGRR